MNAFASLTEHGQSHILQFINRLSSTDTKLFEKDIASFDIQYCCETFQKSVANSKKKLVSDDLQPIPPGSYGVAGSVDADQSYSSTGVEAIADGKVGVILLAGGQGTRLGVDYPKGMYDVGLLSKKTLFQLQAERILRLQQLALERFPSKQCKIRWYIMTSDVTFEATRAFFVEQKWFGLESDQIVYFKQGHLPCFSLDGKLMLESAGKIAVAPDGNGGLYRGLANYGVLSDMATHGIHYLHVYCVDNALVKVADPTFLGYCIQKGADCGNKVLEKTNPKEAVGVTCYLKDVGPAVVEYSELPAELAESRTSDGLKLQFRAANIVNHFFTLEFLEHVVRDEEHNLVPHIAKKKIPSLDADGRYVKPAAPNGYKMEKFVFDVFQFSKNFVVWEGDRASEFSPLKNSDSAGFDCPSSSRRDLFKLHRRWLLESGGKIQHSSVGDARVLNGDAEVNGNGDAENESTDQEVEISPLISYAGEGLQELVSGQIFIPPVYVCLPQEQISGHQHHLHSNGSV